MHVIHKSSYSAWMGGWMVEQKKVMSHTNIYSVKALPFVRKNIFSLSPR